MIVGDTPYLPETEKVNPFTSHTAFLAEAAGALAGWRYDILSKLEEKRAAKLLVNWNAGMTFGKKEGFGAGLLYGHERRRSKIRGNAYQKKISESTKKITSLKNTSRLYTKGATALGLGSVFAISMELGEGLFNLGTSYHSAQRARRFASSNSSNESMYYDTRIAATMRQRALQVIHNSQLSTRAAFGHEASYLHQ